VYSEMITVERWTFTDFPQQRVPIPGTRHPFMTMTWGENTSSVGLVCLNTHNFENTQMREAGYRDVAGMYVRGH
jgi:hypothetical protein